MDRVGLEARSKLMEQNTELIEGARRAAVLELLPTDSLNGETAAFDILLNGAYVGHWSRTASGSTASWVGGPLTSDLGPVGDDEDEIIAAIRMAIPATYLTTD
jgi:hypothetical protein